MAKTKWSGTAIADFVPIQMMIGRTPQDDRLNGLFSSLSHCLFSFLDDTHRLCLKSKVPGKDYFAFENADGHSRSVNRDLFADDNLVQRFLKQALARRINELTSGEITRACYTLCTGFAAVVDLLNPGDHQTPGCLFQYLITHLLTRDLHTNPSERVKVAVGDDSVTLTMDLVLDVGNGQPKYHVAIKTSTRERASEFWAQQHILDEAFPGQYLGYFFGMSETKLDHRNLEVVEICVPEQWRAYQYYLASIKAVYYLDPPNIYLQLRGKPGGVDVKPFGEFFSEAGGPGH